MTVSGARVVTVGYFSARERNHVALMDAADTELTALGARIVGRIVQRRGVSAGGAGKMALPHSSRTLLSSGKVRELAEACEATGADLVVFVAALTEHQQRVLAEVLGRPAVCLPTVLTAV
ncbi:hypothetical protein ABZ572_04350 [Streptomyces sp. NPDC018338]|uniref:HflX-like GTP-binding protein n=1 Tax=Streptomyces sp. NPDC018338 TaxID=3157192 RepID=UPI0033F9D126